MAHGGARKTDGLYPNAALNRVFMWLAQQKPHFSATSDSGMDVFEASRTASFSRMRIISFFSVLPSTRFAFISRERFDMRSSFAMSSMVRASC